MRRLTKWVLACGSAAAIVGINPAQAGPFSVFRGQSAEAAAQPSNQELATKVATALRGANLRGENIEIQVQNGVAVLKGDIADSRQKAAATAAVASVAGIKSVDNQMKPMVASPAAPSGVQQAGFTGAQAGQIQQVQYQAPGQPSNQEVAISIAKNLKAAGLGKHEIEVRYKKGVASLIGDVDHPMEAIKAQEVAYANPSVEQVINKLTAGGLTAEQLMQQIEQQKQGQIQQTGYTPPMPGPAPQMPQGGIQQTGHHMGGPMGAPVGGQPMYNGPNLPNYAWPTYAPYDNYAAVTYPSQYDASAWPYIGPFYPYPQVPMGWRDARLTWDDGSWNLKFNSRTDRWWWFLNPHNWD